jgi:dTDP-4-amino-4,6-dideoxygalactose transaminase
MPDENEEGNEHMNIPIAKPTMEQDEKDAVWKVMESGALAQGQTVAEFERRFADFIGVKHAIATSNGTTALHIGLLSMGIRPGDEVITSPFSFMATATSIIFTGARPVFSDIQADTWNIDPASVLDRITDRTRAIMPVQLYGQSADMDELREIAGERDIMIIEDACQAHGAEYRGRRVGGIGDCGAFSFYPTKNMTTGEGGMITTDSDGIAEEARLLRNHGQTSRYEHAIVGYNFRMTNIHASIGVVQLGKLPGFNRKRQENAGFFTEHLSGLAGVGTPVLAEGRDHVFHQYTLTAERRDELREFLTSKGISTGIYYPDVLYNYDAIKPYFTERCSRSEEATKQVISLPIHPYLTREELEYIVGNIREWSENSSA